MSLSLFLNYIQAILIPYYCFFFSPSSLQPLSLPQDRVRVALETPPEKRTSVRRRAMGVSFCVFHFLFTSSCFLLLLLIFYLRRQSSYPYIHTFYYYIHLHTYIHTYRLMLMPLWRRCSVLQLSSISRPRCVGVCASS